MLTTIIRRLMPIAVLIAFAGIMSTSSTTQSVHGQTRTVVHNGIVDYLGCPTDPYKPVGQILDWDCPRQPYYKSQFVLGLVPKYTCDLVRSWEGRNFRIELQSFIHPETGEEIWKINDAKEQIDLRVYICERKVYLPVTMRGHIQREPTEVPTPTPRNRPSPTSTPDLGSDTISGYYDWDTTVPTGHGWFEDECHNRVAIVDWGSFDSEAADDMWLESEFDVSFIEYEGKLWLLYTWKGPDYPISAGTAPPCEEEPTPTPDAPGHDIVKIGELDYDPFVEYGRFSLECDGVITRADVHPDLFMKSLGLIGRNVLVRGRQYVAGDGNIYLWIGVINETTLECDGPTPTPESTAIPTSMPSATPSEPEPTATRRCPPIPPTPPGGLPTMPPMPCPTETPSPPLMQRTEKSVNPHAGQPTLPIERPIWERIRSRR